MSTGLTTARRIRLGYPKGQDGRPVCRWCRGPITAQNRRLWCSQACVDQYRLRNDPQFIRAKVWERDQGICQTCGLDVQALMAHIKQVRWGDAGGWAEYSAWLYRMGFTDLLNRRGGGLWQADHVIEVAAGGAELGLDNLRLCCTVCHRAKTARFARERAEARRRQKQPELAI